MKNKKKTTDLSKKLYFYDLQGKRKERVIFRVGVPQCMWTDKNKSYGAIELYDDMTEQDVLSHYRSYKKERVNYLRSCGIKIRKHITKNSFRSYEWYKMAEPYGDKPNYKEIAKDWSKNNKKEVNVMLFRYLWNDPNGCISPDLKDKITAVKSERKIFDTFLDEYAFRLKPQQIKADLNNYVEFYLPRLMRSAIHRYKKSL